MTFFDTSAILYSMYVNELVSIKNLTELGIKQEIKSSFLWYWNRCSNTTDPFVYQVLSFRTISHASCLNSNCLKLDQWHNMEGLFNLLFKQRLHF